MTKSMLIFFAMLVVGLAAQPVLAGDEREFIDKTAATTLPNIGMIELHILCDLEFPGTHMCSSGDIVRNGGTLNLQGLSAWVHPSRVIERAESGSYDSASGVGTSAGGNLSCAGWGSDKSEFDGLILRPSGLWGLATCDGEQPVACCAVANFRGPSFPQLPPLFPPIPTD